MIERYNILEQLGEGGAGSVFKAWDTKLQRFVAIKKLLPPEQRQSAGAGDNLASEAAALSALQHPNIVSVFDLDTDGPEQFVVMEFINGETLEATVRRGALLPDDFQQIARESLDGLSAAHRLGMCHRDLKPSNIMFHWLPDGKWQTKLLDFGLANMGLRPAQQELAGEGTVAGSVHFMSPEQFLRQPLDARSDLYSLGCVLYYSLTGSYPCNGATVEEVMNAHLAHQVSPLQPLRPDVESLLTDWILWLMSRQPEERPESTADALRVFQGLLSGELKNLPVQRALKTQPVPRRTAVVAAPLSKDTQARAKSIETSAVLETPATPAPRPAPAQNKKPPAAKAPAPAKSKKPLLAGVAIAALAAGAVIYFLTRKSGGGEGEKPGNVTAPPGNPTTGGPPDKNLIIWYDAARGARKDAGTALAAPGDRVDQWDDSAPLAGNNPAQYHTSGSGPEERAQRRPTLVRITGEGGLKGTHDVISFSGENCLVFARDKDKVGDPVAGELSGSELSWIAVFSAGSGRQETLLAARVGSEATAWDTFVSEGKVFAGVRKSGGALNHSQLPWAGTDYRILSVVWDGECDRLRLWVTGHDGKTTTSTASCDTTDFGDLQEIRLGASKPPVGFTDGLQGRIASLLIYNRALDDTDREAAVDYLCRRYFGVPAQK